ncbi:transglutaminase domain-containing protein [Microbulbifer aestuariivivens]
MRRYLQSAAKGYTSTQRMNSVIDDLKKRNFYLQYDLNHTTSASEAFSLQKGNCISHAAMIVAMARHLGLEAHLNQSSRNAGTQVAESESGVRFRQRISHINAVVMVSEGAFIVEQDYRIYRGKDLNLLSDRKAKSLYLNNLAIEAMLRGELEQAFVHIRHAIERDYDDSTLWVSLGTLYRRIGDTTLAQQSFTHALNLNPGDAMALHNLALLQDSSRFEEAYVDNFIAPTDRPLMSGEALEGAQESEQEIGPLAR